LVPGETRSGQGVNFSQFLDALQLLTAHIDLQSGLKIHAEGLCAAETDTRRLHDALRAGLGMARLGTSSENPELLRAIDFVKITQQQKTVLVDVNWPLSVLEEVMKLAPKR
jgi:hypothetical protein